MPSTPRSRNHIALAFLIVGKLLGVVGLVVGSSQRLLGGMFLGLDGVFILIAVGVCISTMKAREKEADSHKAVLRQMMKEGTLEQYIRDVRVEDAQAKENDRNGPALEQRAETALG